MIVPNPYQIRKFRELSSASAARVFTNRQESRREIYRREIYRDGGMEGIKESLEGATI
jgi:hypothetical protein